MIMRKGFNETVLELNIEKNAAMETRRQVEKNWRLQRFTKLTEMLAAIDCGMDRKQLRQLIEIDPEKTDRMVARKVLIGAIKAIPRNMFYCGPLWLLLVPSVGLAAFEIGAFLSIGNIMYICRGVKELDIIPMIGEYSTVSLRDLPSFRRWQYFCERLLLKRKEIEQALTKYLPHPSK